MYVNVACPGGDDEFLEQWPGGEKPTVETLVAVRFSEYGLIYRAKVMRI